jgi:hypothetical protein
MSAINLQMGFNRDAENEIQECAAQIAAVGDLLTRAADVPVETASNAGWLVRSLAERFAECVASTG